MAAPKQPATPTPGPWKPTCTRLGRWVVEMGPNMQVEAPDHLRLREADATLMARAPDLLEAVRVLAGALRRGHPWVQDSAATYAGEGGSREALDAVNEALAHPAVVAALKEVR